MAVFYLLATWTVLIGLCSLAVDFGRVETVKCQLQAVADAAARAGMYNLPSGSASVQYAAVSVAASNSVDGAPVGINGSTDVVVGYWNPVAQTFAATPIAQANAVQVTAHRTAADGTAVPLLFASAIGKFTCDVRSVGIACHAENVPVVNAGFELPVLSAGGYVYDQAMPGWTLTGTACLVTYGSAWGAAQPAGNQCIALQGTPGNALGVITQTFPAVTGTYAMTFLAARRNSYGIEPVSISIDGVAIEVMQPTATTFASHSTPNFTLATGNHAVTFAATTAATDSATFVDSVAINPVNGNVLLAK